MRIDCTCHDPTVFGHVSCSRAETQPNNSPPILPSTPLPFTRINAATLEGFTVTCGVISADMITLNDLTLETREHLDRLTAMVQHIEQAEDGPPRHG